MLAHTAMMELAVLNTKSGRLCEKAKKDLIRKFNELGLSITALTNQQRTNFLDITFDRANDTYKPYRKPNDEPLYINNSSNHPPSILRELPNSINKRINTLSCDKGTFDAVDSSPVQLPSPVQSMFCTMPCVFHWAVYNNKLCLIIKNCA